MVAVSYLEIIFCTTDLTSSFKRLYGKVRYDEAVICRLRF